jgi:hypothetical protein
MKQVEISKNSWHYRLNVWLLEKYGENVEYVNYNKTICDYWFFTIVGITTAICFLLLASMLALVITGMTISLVILLFTNYNILFYISLFIGVVVACIYGVNYYKNNYCTEVKFK